ncbi:MAG: SoxR reducing system RseC family protein [Propionivibrio sp.]|uniref:SoxR reducing system RseC family protein n=1 Tax=Propionivibrio sp. TaxID=2212460 RepID=UPI001A5B152E|nr:SoxR reducing system RseC family protein [Propionivibrio sp.]MBL8416106.1 SoxR reducing system RseC family protein [Propionivibrio sp.]
MIDAQGTITALDGEYALVRMDESGCGRCHEHGGCGGNNTGKMFCSAPRTFRVLNPRNSVIGERVTIAVAEGALRRSATLAYGLPLLALFVGALTGSALAGETGAIFGSICGLLFSWLLLRYAQLHSTPDQLSQPFIRY